MGGIHPAGLKMGIIFFIPGTATHLYNHYIVSTG
jgi:hypothetical protein